MKSEYTSDDLLPLSGIQHFCFCRRQWALLTIERQWQENALTVEGKLMHSRADNPYDFETRQGVIITRSVPVASYRLGLNGICDVVEFTSMDCGVKLPGHEGLFMPSPVEYKHGRRKHEPSDEVQLCAQMICLEEMLSVHIPSGALFYGETRQRIVIEMTDKLRKLVEDLSQEMHKYFDRGYTPKVKPSKACRSCSLCDLCLPEMQNRAQSASEYIRQQIEG